MTLDNKNKYFRSSWSSNRTNTHGWLNTCSCYSSVVIGTKMCVSRSHHITHLTEHDVLLFHLSQWLTCTVALCKKNYQVVNRDVMKAERQAGDRAPKDEEKRIFIEQNKDASGFFARKETDKSNFSQFTVSPLFLPVSTVAPLWSQSSNYCPRWSSNAAESAQYLMLFQGWCRVCWESANVVLFVQCQPEGAAGLFLDKSIYLKKQSYVKEFTFLDGFNNVTLHL